MFVRWLPAYYPTFMLKLGFNCYVILVNNLQLIVPTQVLLPFQNQPKVNLMQMITRNGASQHMCAVERERTMCAANLLRVGNSSRTVIAWDGPFLKLLQLSVDLICLRAFLNSFYSFYFPNFFLIATSQLITPGCIASPYLWQRSRLRATEAISLSGGVSFSRPHPRAAMAMYKLTTA